MVLGHCVEQLTHGQYRPSVGSSPGHRRLLLKSLYISVTEYALLGNPHAVDEESGYACRLVKLLRVVGVGRACGHRRESHEHVVEPHRIVVRTVARYRSVGKTVGVVLHNVVVTLDYVADFQCGIGHCGTHESCRHCACVIKSGGRYHLTHLSVMSAGT